MASLHPQFQVCSSAGCLSLIINIIIFCELSICYLPTVTCPPETSPSAQGGSPRQQPRQDNPFTPQNRRLFARGLQSESSHPKSRGIPIPDQAAFSRMTEQAAWYIASICNQSSVCSVCTWRMSDSM